MSRLLQPSVVFIEGGEKPFYKKVPKTEKQNNPKLLKKQLPKLVKTGTPEDRVLFLATADNPWMGQAKSIPTKRSAEAAEIQDKMFGWSPFRPTQCFNKMKDFLTAKTFDKIIPVFPPDQSTASTYWHHKLMGFHGVDRNFLYSPLARCMKGFTLPIIEKVIASVMTAERIVALKYRPLDPQEFLDKLLQESPVLEKQRVRLLEWYQGTYSLAKKKAEKAKVDAELREKLAAIEAKKNEQKKKKK